MADQEFTLQLGIPREYPIRWTKRYSYRCHNSDGLNHCDCMLECNKSQEECCFYGRPIEPLAFYLPPFSDVEQQNQCPLYSVLPKEIRDLVWEYALADDGAPSPDCDNVFRRERGTEANVAKVDVAHALLQTCKAVYLETYRLPMLLNGYLSYRHNGPSRPDLERIAPWQYALIQRVDLSLQQVSVEGEDLERELAGWNPTLRHSGAYVAPRFYSITRPDHRSEGVVHAHNFGLTVPFEDAAHFLKDGDKVTLPQKYYKPYSYDDDYRVRIPSSFTARAMVARPLTHLTLRISRTDWWTWTDDPKTTDSNKQLALDPACGKTTRPLVADMLALAASRRAGQHPVYDMTWGAAIGVLQDLKTLELILETFSVKKHQLKTVVECAKTWKFPLKDTQYELTCDGKVESMKWAKAADEDSGWVTDSEPGSEDMDLDNGYSSSDEQSEGHDSYEEALRGDQERESVSNENGGLDESSDEQEPVNIELLQDDDSISSPVYNYDGDADDWQSLPDEPWLHTATEFKVRIVRFRRRRTD